jgi:homoserine kinase
MRKAASKWFEIRLPATSANLGPAFDAAALAFDLFLSVRARVSKTFSIEASGRDAAICNVLENHLIVTTYREVLEGQKRVVVPLELRIKNEIPIGKGCGSSAAARLAGIALAVHFGRLQWDENRIIFEAAQREHHPDNAAACWFGGLAVASVSERNARIASFTPKGKWPLLLAVPEEVLRTEEARRVLPSEYSRGEVVGNIQNSMLLLLAFVQGRPELLREALQDYIHQPYRAPLCRLLEPLQQLSGRHGVLGACLSGAGPSVLMFLDPKNMQARTVTKVSEFLRQRDLVADLIPARIVSQKTRME